MDNTDQQNRHEKWKAIFAEYEKSNLSQVVFCKQQNLSLAQFGYYRSLLKQKTVKKIKSAGTFSSVKISTLSNTEEIRLTLPNGFQCAFPCNLNKIQIKGLLEILLAC